MSCTLCFIHGLNSSKHSFAYMAQELGGVSKINYDSHQPLAESIVQVSRQLPKKDPIILIGHSLGGVIGLSLVLTKTHNVQKLVTISSPLGGSGIAAFTRWFMNIPVLSDITPSSPFIRQFQELQADVPVLSIVSTSGHMPVSYEQNDSVVAVKSQRALQYAKQVDVKANHFEVLLHEKTIKTVREFVQPEN